MTTKLLNIHVFGNVRIRHNLLRTIYVENPKFYINTFSLKYFKNCLMRYYVNITERIPETIVKLVDRPFNCVKKLTQ